MTTVTEKRLAMKAAGFSPIPCKGKIPVGAGWQHADDLSEADIRRMPESNTGILCRTNPAFDIDVSDPEAADAVEELIEDFFADRGVMPVRFGAKPKRAILFRTSTPFPKITVSLVDPSGKAQRLEILCNGQQAIVDGIHPDTKRPYAWFGAPPWELGRDALVEVTEAEMRACAELCSTLLQEHFGYTQAHTNGHDHAGAGAEAGDPRGPVDVEAEFASMVDEATVNAAQCRIIPSLLRKGEHPADVLDFVVDGTMEHIGSEFTPEWTREREVGYVRKRILAAYNNVLLKDYAIADGVPIWLPGEFHEGWLERISTGRRPRFHYTSKFCLRGIDEHSPGTERPRRGKGTSPADESPRPHKERAAPGPGKAKPGWSYYDTTKLEPTQWLVKGILPQSGVAILSGQWGAFKTTVALDMSVSIMTNELFAGKYRVKRPGAVLYLAAEGAGTLQSRLASIARDRGAPDKLPFAWRGDCPPLTDNSAAATLTKYVEEAYDYFQQTYNMPVVVLWVDTWSQTAGLESGEDNDTAATGKALKTLRTVGEKTGVLPVAIDHYGKMLEAGTRGSSNKEGSTDTVLSALAEREINGSISNTRLAVRKQRDGLSGFEVAFTPQTVEIGIDEDGDAQTAITVAWGEERTTVKATRWSKSLRLLQHVIQAVLAKGGIELCLPNGEVVTAAYKDDVRAEYFAQYPVDDRTTKLHQDDARRKAFDRAIDDAQGRGLIGHRMVQGSGVIWLSP